MTAGPADAGTTERAVPESAERAPTRPMVIILTLVVSAFVMILNETILSVALPHLTGDLHVSTTTVQWLTSGFLLTMGVVIPTTGFILQRFTPRQVFLAAMTLFTLGTLICALAPGFPILLVGRVVQACGTAVMIPLLMTSVMTLIPPERRGATMGSITIVIAVAPAIGPTIGGLILASLDWRWMFWSVLPLSAIALVIGFALIRVSSEKRSIPLDLLSVLMSAIAFGGIVYGFSTLGHGGEAFVPPWSALVVGLVVLVLFVWRQLRLQRRDAALLDLRPFGHRSFTVSVVLAALLFMCLLGAGAILLPIYLQTVLKVSTATTGLAVLPGGLLLGFMGRPVGRLFDRVGARPLVIPGAIGLAIAMWLFTALGASAPLWTVIAVHVLLMAALGLMMTPLFTSGLSVLPVRLYSHGSAILTTLQQVAGAAGTAGFVTVAAIGSATAGGQPDAAGLRLAFMAAGIVGVLAVVVSLFLPKQSPAPEADADITPPAADPSADPSAEPASGPSAVAVREPEDAATVETAVPAAAAVPAGASSHDGSTSSGRAGDHSAGDHAAGDHSAEGWSAGAHSAGDDSAEGRSSVAGTVLAGGRPVPGAVVTLVDADGRQHGRAPVQDGRYQCELPGTGTWMLVVSAPGHAPEVRRLFLDRPARRELDVSLRPTPPTDGAGEVRRPTVDVGS